MRTQKSADHFDLLPFIAILMCILGCLLLVTMSTAALQMGPAAGEGWIPTKDSQFGAKIPVLIEWDGANLLMHNNRGQEKIKWTAPKTIEIGGLTLQTEHDTSDENPSLNRLLDDLETRKATHYALFAVRPSGFAQFNLMAYDFKKRKIDIGYEPLAQVKSVRLLPEKTTNTLQLTTP